MILNIAANDIICTAQIETRTGLRFHHERGGNVSIIKVQMYKPFFISYKLLVYFTFPIYSYDIRFFKDIFVYLLFSLFYVMDIILIFLRPSCKQILDRP